MIIKSVLPTIGIINKNAYKKGKDSLKLDKKEYTKIPGSFIGFFAGIVDGDGYIQITKTSKGFIAIKLVISIHLEDISTLQYLHSVLKTGKITVYKDNKSPTCKLIFNKTDLQEIIFPLLLHHKIHFLTTNRRHQFDLAMFIFKQDVKMYKLIPGKRDIPTIFTLPKTPLDYLKLSYFEN